MMTGDCIVVNALDAHRLLSFHNVHTSLGDE